MSENTQTPVPIVEETLYDPYEKVPDEKKGRINSDVAFDDINFIKSIHPRRGVLQCMVNMFFRSIVGECKALNITSYDKQHEFIALVKRRTTAWFAEQRHKPDDSGAVAATRTDTPPNANHTSDDAQRTGGRKRVAGPRRSSSTKTKTPVKSQFDI